MPALEVYNGPYFLTLSKLYRDGLFPKDVQVLILSAKYGLISLHDHIVPYDEKITRTRAIELKAEVTKKLVDFVRYHRINEVVINLGETYRLAVEDLPKSVPNDCKVLYLSGSIIQRRKALKEYLLK